MSVVVNYSATADTASLHRRAQGNGAAAAQEILLAAEVPVLLVKP